MEPVLVICARGDSTMPAPTPAPPPTPARRVTEFADVHVDAMRVASLKAAVLPGFGPITRPPVDKSQHLYQMRDVA